MTKINSAMLISKEIGKYSAEILKREQDWEAVELFH